MNLLNIVSSKQNYNLNYFQMITSLFGLQRLPVPPFLFPVLANVAIRNFYQQRAVYRHHANSGTTDTFLEQLHFITDRK